ncbi:hypothetical protein vBAbaPP1_169 [Acinetobacter phage vB_AbaM_P1]|nr:hypothetical protein vBAbaPP1_169 [Acinetobacter phage vB_AbaM_P1]WAX22651.1 hypothetical protein [Acinetobacter phage vB_AbaP_HB01]
MNTFNVELVKKIESDLATSKVVVMDALTAMQKVPSYMSEHIANADYTMRQALVGNNSSIASVLSGLTHAAWSEFFDNHLAHHLIIDRECVATNKHVFADTYKRSLYNGVNELVEFNQDNAKEFFNDFLNVDRARCSKWLKEVLERTGKDWKNSSKEFKTKMTLRGLDSYGTVSRELGRTLFAVCKHLGLEFTFNKYYTELRNHSKINGDKFKVNDDLDITFEYHQNGNTTLRISKDLVDMLNGMLEG